MDNVNREEKRGDNNATNAPNNTVRSSKKPCKGNVTAHFEIMPTDLNEYVALKLIAPSDIYTYFLLLQFDNRELGYAFPSVSKLMELTGSSNKTVLTSLTRLEQAGLIGKAKSDLYPNKSIYYVYKPLTANELHSDSTKEVIECVEQFKERKEKIEATAKKDKQRLADHLEEVNASAEISDSEGLIAEGRISEELTPDELALMEKALKLENSYK